MNNKLVSVGKIINFHGIKGEIKLGFSADKEGLIKSLKKVYVFAGNKKQELNIEYVRFHKKFALLKFDSYNSINDVLPLKGLLVHIYEDELKKKFDKDEYLVTDLIGAQVFDTNNNKVGVVENVGENGASDLICVRKPNAQTFLVPFVKELVPLVEVENKKIVIKMLDGIDE